MQLWFNIFDRRLWNDGFFLAFVGFPLLALGAGFLTAALAPLAWRRASALRRLGLSAAAGALTTVVLSFTVANTTLLVWLPIHAAVGLVGGVVWQTAAGLVGYAGRMLRGR